MAKAARKKTKRLLREPKFYYQAVLFERPTLKAIAKAPWVKLQKWPPEFPVITIDGDKVDKLDCHMSRGFFKTAADMVCWVNKDDKEHVIQFLNGRWPFDPALNPGNEQITVPAKGTSGWFRLSSSSGAPGLSVRYEYGLDIAPGPPGPGIISDD